MPQATYMPTAAQRAASDRNLNNFGLLRLLFATLVIVSHSPEIVDGNRSREILTSLFGRMSFGEIAVDGFFLVSGFLITKSFVGSNSLRLFLFKRLLRIVPGYIVSFWICVIVISPFVGVGSPALSGDTVAHNAARSLLLLPPDVRGVFHGIHYATLNGPMWTITYEFACYLATALLGVFCFYQPRYKILCAVMALSFVLLHGWGCTRGLQIPGAPVFASAIYNTRFAAVYLVGALFFLFGDHIRLTGKGACVSALFLVVLLYNWYLAETAFMFLGGYVIFWFALKARVINLGILRQRDISYGMYLYAWPIQSFIVWHNIHINPWALCFFSILSAGVVGYLSWTYVEKPALQFLRNAGATWNAGNVKSTDPVLG